MRTDAAEGRAAEAAARLPGFAGKSVAAGEWAAQPVPLPPREALVAGAGVGKLAAQAISLAVAMFFNFVGNKLWTFADPGRK